MKEKTLTFRYALLQLTFGVAFAGIVVFTSYYLLARGLNNTRIGLVIAIAGLLAALMQPVVGIIMDRFPRITSPKLLGLLILILLAAVGLLILLPEPGLLPVALFYGMAILIVQIGQSILNVIGVDSMTNGNRLNFNFSRAFGCFGYASSAWGIGMLTSRFEPVVLLIVVLVFASAALVTALTYPLKTGDKDGTVRKAEEASGPLVFLKKYPKFALLLPALILIYFSHCILNSFTLQIMNAIGGGSEEMGTTTAIAACLELITVLCFGFYKKYFKVGTLLRISACFFLLKAILSALVTSVVAYYAVQICQMFAWGIICVGLVYYVNEKIPMADRAKGQTYAGMTLTVASVLCGVIGGPIIDGSGIGTLMILGCIVCACGGALLFVATGEGRLRTAGE